MLKLLFIKVEYIILFICQRKNFSLGVRMLRKIQIKSKTEKTLNELFLISFLKEKIFSTYSIKSLSEKKF